MTQPIITPAKTENIKSISALQKELLGGGWSESALAEAALNENAVILVAEDNGGAVAGFINAGALPFGEAEIFGLAVSKEYRRRGVAAALHNALLKELNQKGIKSVSLEVRESNSAAIAFYLKQGYLKNGLRKNFYDNPNENAVLMRLE